MIALQRSFCSPDIPISVSFSLPSTLSGFKMTSDNGITYDVMKWLA